MNFNEDMSRAFLFSFMPRCAKSAIKINGLMKNEIAKTEKLMGKEKTKELITQFSKEAFAMPHVVNHKYIIRKLHEARESFRYDA
jgi:hypothetical protein